MKKYNVLALALATSIALAGCGNNANEVANENEKAETEQTETVEETTEEVANEAETATEESAEEAEAPAEETAEEATDGTEETATDVASEEGNVILHRLYPKDAGSRSFVNVVVATSGDKIVGALIDEYQYFDKDSDYQGVAGSEGAFGEGAAEGKVLGSKIQNNEAYSADMKAAGGEITLLDNYNAVTEFATGKTIAELEEFLASNEDEAIMDALSSATFKSTPGLLQMVVDAAKSNEFVSSGNATNPEDIELRYTVGAPHGDKSFGNAVVAVEGDTIVAASIDEYQYLEGAINIQDKEAGFVGDYADENKVLGSKLENNESYSDLMAEKAGSEVSIKDNYKAIENFVVGKTIDEVKEVIASANPGEAIDAVTGATLVDTVGYLQLIVDAAENNIRVQ